LYEDISNNDFNIVLGGGVTSPNDGEVLTGLFTHTIAWNAYAGATNYTLAYSTVGTGGPWTTIATGVTGTSYVWTVPNVAATTCRIRVSSFNGATWLYQDFSDRDFTIQKVAGNLSSPNGGETLAGLESQTVTWNAYPGATNYTLSYSTTGSGGPWSTIATGITGTSYVWSIPNTGTTAGSLRISSFNGGTWLYQDYTDANFTVVRSGDVLSPNGGETFAGLSSQLITWSAYPGSTSYTLGYSTAGCGGPWTTIATGLTEPSRIWTVPNTATTTGCIRLSVFNGGTWLYQDVSDGTFTIQRSGDVLSPNGGEVFGKGSSQTITWRAYPGATSYTVAYSTNGTSGPWTTIASGVTGTSQSWTVPNVSTTTARIRVSVYNMATWLYQDFSDGNFTIGP